MLAFVHCDNNKSHRRRWKNVWNNWIFQNGKLVFFLLKSFVFDVLITQSRWQRKYIELKKLHTNLLLLTSSTISSVLLLLCSKRNQVTRFCVINFYHGDDDVAYTLFPFLSNLMINRRLLRRLNVQNIKIHIKGFSAPLTREFLLRIMMKFLNFAVSDFNALDEE